MQNFFHVYGDFLKVVNLFHPFFEISRISSAGSRNGAMNWHGKLLCTKYNSVRFIADRTCRFGYPVRK